MTAIQPSSLSVFFSLLATIFIKIPTSVFLLSFSFYGATITGMINLNMFHSPSSGWHKICKVGAQCAHKKKDGKCLAGYVNTKHSLILSSFNMREVLILTLSILNVLGGCISWYIPSDGLLMREWQYTASRCPLGSAPPSRHLSGLGKSLGRRGCTTSVRIQYIPPLGSVCIQYKR